MNTFALFGDNTQESLSPKIYKNLSHQYGVELKYHCFNLDPMEYDFSLLNGFNITSPFKKNTFRKIHSIFDCSEVSKKTGYANIYDNKKKLADNTDVYGIEKTLQVTSLENLSIALIGAGDVSSSILEVLANKKVSIFNRTDKSQQYLNQNFNLLSDFEPKKFDLIINSTPIEIDHKFQFDLNYHRYQNSLLNGLSMLIWQAMKNFSIWFDITYEDELELKKEIFNEIKK